MTLPDTIQTIVRQIRAHGIMSAFIQTGTDLKSFVYHCPREIGECRPKENSSFTPALGVTYHVGLEFTPNGKRGERWRFVVAYEQNDTYTVYMTGFKDRQHFLIESAADVYCDNLNDVLNRMYDDALVNRNDSCLPCD